MKYYPLKNIFHMGQKDYRDEIEKRTESYSTYKTNMKIKPITNGNLSNETVHLFINYVPELVSLNEIVNDKSREIRELISTLPDISLKQYQTKLLINELQSTNEIEGVQSTKEEISDIIESQKNNTTKKNYKRFEGMVKLYSYLPNKEEIKTVRDIRAVYDQLVSQDVDKDDKLDGAIFRKKFVGVESEGEYIHRGVLPEKDIIFFLEDMIDFIETNKLPDLIKYTASHYYFEYIHPFYDGNGRTGRYIICSFLSKKLDVLSAVTFSYMINRRKAEYYKMFELTSHKMNEGELTHFTIEMLKLIQEGQEIIIEDLQEKKMQLDVIEENIKNLDKSNFEKRVLYVLAQSWLFSWKSSRVSLKELEEFLNCSRTRINNAVENLQEYLVLTKKRPKIYTLKEEIALGFLKRE